MNNSDDCHHLKTELYQQVRENHAIFEFLRGGSLAGIWYWDLQAPEHEWISGEFWQTLGYDHHNKTQPVTEWRSLINQDDLVLLQTGVARHCADQGHAFELDARYQHADGSTIWLRCRALVIRDATGKPIRMLSAHTDITQLKRLQEQQQQLLHRIQNISESNQHLEEFAFVASHDLNAPLRRITNFLELIASKLEDKGDEELLGWMGTVKGNAVYMQRMIDDLLELCRTSATDLEIEPLDLNRIVEQVMLSMEIDKHEWAGEIIIEDLPTMLGTETLITRLIENLINNALTYSKPVAPRIRIYGSQENGETILHIEDNGIGIDPKYHEEVFELFKRLHTRQTYGGGTGMGLAICQRIAQRHQGCVEIESALDKGTLVTVRFNSELVAVKKWRVEACA